MEMLWPLGFYYLYAWIATVVWCAVHTLRHDFQNIELAVFSTPVGC